jgi:hypothetical protein
MLRSIATSIADITSASRVRAGLACAIAATLVVVGSASGQEGTSGFEITHSTQSSGGGTSSGGDFSLGVMLLNWGPCPGTGAGSCQGDINADGIIDGSDLGGLLVHWG